MNVVSVTDVGDSTHARWLFDTNVSTLTTGASLTIQGTPPDVDFSISGPKTVTVGYSGGFSGGDAWAVAAGAPGITFAGGAILTPGQSGSVA